MHTVHLSSTTNNMTLLKSKSLSVADATAVLLKPSLEYHQCSKSKLKTTSSINNLNYSKKEKVIF